ncbi:unnamed protein product, partial [Effrenium voratum]
VLAAGGGAATAGAARGGGDPSGAEAFPGSGRRGARQSAAFRGGGHAQSFGRESE